MQMATWSFRDALEELEVRRHFDESMLQSAAGICLGDIRFVEIQTSIKMRAIWFSTFLHYVEKGMFNPDKLGTHCCSQTTAILLAFIPDRRVEDIESIGIGNVIRRCGTPLGDIPSISTMIDSVHSVLKTESKKDRPRCRAYMMLIGNYGGHMAFATEPPYCVAYAADYEDKDPSKMMPRETLNHMYAMVANNMMMRRLLSVPNWDPAERKRTKGGYLLIPRGVQFSPKLFPEIVIPRATMQVHSLIRQCMTGCPTSDCWVLPSHGYYILLVFQEIWNCSLPKKWPSWRSWGFWTLYTCLNARLFSCL